jgi:hypothetical protein
VLEVGFRDVGNGHDERRGKRMEDGRC